MAITSRLTPAERESAALEELYKRNNPGSGTPYSKFANSSFLANEDVKAFNQELRKEGMKKLRKPVKLGGIDETFNEIKDYFDLCDLHAQLPSKKSLCLYLGITSVTFDAYRNDIDSEYSDLFNFALDYIHSIIEGGALNNKINPATYIFTATNFYGMRDARNVDITASSGPRIDAQSTRDSIAALREQLKTQGITSGATELDYEEVKDSYGDNNE
nr:MAG TPA: DNA-packaging protein [Bacteriophage sp.]